MRQPTRGSAELFLRGTWNGNHFAAAWVVGAEAAHAPRCIQERIMLGWAVTFLIVALVAALFGFGGIAAVAVDAAKIIFFVAIILFVISAVVMLIRGRSPTMP
jgi:uncharacterized membrane protein YtjA (UPF0391 family)